MRRHRALGLAVVLVVVCLVPIAPSSLGLITPISVLAQDAGEPEAGAPTDLAVVALHCAEAPAADALTSYFATGTPPEACAPAVGVAIIVSENDAALPNSPFRTDVAGSLVVPVGLGSQVEVAEDAESLPDGYEPLIGEANSVPYANPVRLDEAVAGAAVLFVNVPAPVAALAQEAGEDVGAEDAASPAVSAAPETNGCDLAVPAAGDAAMLAPLPVPSAQGANITNTNTNTNTGIGSDPMSRARAPSDVAVASDPVRTSAGIWSWQSRQSSSDRLWRFDGSRADDWRLHGKGLWLWPGDHASDGARSLAFSGSSVRIGDGIWFLNWDGDQSGRWFGAGRFGTDHLAAASTGGGSRALVSNAVHIGDGVWRWPGHDRADDGRDHENDTWTWDDDRDRDHDWRMNDRGVWVRSGSFASSGNGSVAVSAHSVHIGPGIWFWPHDRHRADDWRWRARHRFDDWFVHGNGVWRWPGRIGIDHVAAARSGSGSLAIVASSVRIGGHGVWLLPPGHVGHGDDWRRPSHTGSGIWVLSTAIARSSSGTLAISSHAVRIDTGVWRLPSDRDRDHHWLSQGGHARGNEASIAPQAISANHDVESAPGKLEPTSSVEQPAPASGEEATAAAPLADPADSPGGDVGQPAVETADVVDNGGGAASDETVEAPTDMAASSSDVAPAAVDPAPVAPVAEPAPAAAPDAGYVAPDPVYSEPAAVEPATAPAADVPAAAPSAEPVYVAPAPDYVEPALEDPSAGSSGYVEPAFVEPAVDPGYVEPAVEPGFADPVVESPASFAPDPGLDPGTGAPGAGAPNLGFADPGGDAGGVAPEPVTAAPDGGGPGLDGPVNAAPGIGHDGPGNGGTESIAPGNVEPTADMGPSGGDGEDE
jgi:hypothetical protein